MRTVFGTPDFPNPNHRSQLSAKRHLRFIPACERCEGLREAILDNHNRCDQHDNVFTLRSPGSMIYVRPYFRESRGG